MDRVGKFTYVCPQTGHKREVTVWASYDEMGETEFVQYILSNGSPVQRNRSQCNTHLSKAVLKFADECVIMDDTSDESELVATSFTHNKRTYTVEWFDSMATIKHGSVDIGEPFKIEDAQSPLECAALEALMMVSDLVQTRLLASTGSVQ